MSKDLPFFKFHPDEYLTGDITLLDWQLQGIFVHICAYYWKRDCSMTMVKLKQRYNQVTNEQWDTLTEGSKILKYNPVTGGVNITFLDEQLAEREEDSKQKSEFGYKGAKKRWSSHGSAKGKLSKKNSHPTNQPMAENSNIDKDKEKEEEKEYSSEVVELYDSVLVLFDEKTRPHTLKQISDWHDTLDKCIRIDGYTPEQIHHIVKRMRMDDFWRTNFMSVMKLRQTNKENVKYIDVFAAKCNGSLRPAFGIQQRQRDYVTPQTSF